MYANITKLIKVLRLCQKQNWALDIGCGAGANSLFLLTNGFNHVDAVDIESDNDKLIKTIPLEAGQSINFVNSDIQDFSPERTYDLIIALNVLHFVDSKNLDNVFNKFRQWLNPGGLLYFRVFSTKEPTIDKFKTKNPNNDYFIGDRLMHYFTEDEIRKWIYGYEIFELSHINLPDKHPPQGQHQHWIFDVVVRK